MTVDLLIENARAFRSRISAQRDDFARLAHGQTPSMLFISCSDSRVIPAAITGAEPGQLFELRTAGAIVPPYSTDAACGVAATIEFALTELGIRHVVVCGHTHCGAVKGLLEPAAVTGPAIATWLGQPHLRGVETTDTDPVLRAAGQQHVLNQLAQLRQHPAVAGLADAGELTLHGWFYEVHTGAVAQFNPATGTFGPL
jgi:carbonic anhydrase